MLVQQGAGVGDPDTNWNLESKPDPERTLEIQTGSGKDPRNTNRIRILPNRFYTKLISYNKSQYTCSTVI